MERVCTLECMKQYIELKSKMIALNYKYKAQKDVFLNTQDAILLEQINYPKIKENLQQTAQELRNLLQSCPSSSSSSESNNNINKKLHLSEVRRRYEELSAHLHSIDNPQENSLEKKLEECRNLLRLYREKLEEMVKQRSDLLEFIRMAENVKIFTRKDLEIVIAFRENHNWRGKVSVADEVGILLKNELIARISDSPVSDALVIHRRFIVKDKVE